VEDQQENKYEVIITDQAEITFYQIVECLYDHYSLDRAEEIANQIRDKAGTLVYQGAIGNLEPQLKHRKEDYRFILYKRSQRADIKIIYFINEKERKVYVIDFFPTEMDNTKILKRS
jgi:plasmid stabilization system protein ParE